MALTPTRETILEYIKAQLESIEAGATYHTTLGEGHVTRDLQSLDTLQDGDMPMVVIAPGDETLAPEGKTSAKRTYLFEVYIVGFIKSDSPSKSSTDVENFLSDIRYLLANDPGLGSNALDTDIISIRTDVGVVADPEYGVIVINLAVMYDSPNANP